MNTVYTIIIVMLIGFVGGLGMANVDDRTTEIITAIQSNGCTNSTIEPSVNKERIKQYKIKGGLYD